uniref:ATP synthase subunit a n=1 Tax=Cacopsylla burckhardti TaxID=2593410 RepID=A0A8K1SPB8_9HEMI|nr:ATP synthase F0 subunit 6 [Cacopsylla burckhardti]UFP91882.1 ATP synthase F0 subunit 6 [Cacopsylla burckhardti]WAK85085.1 ATP synthase F0 subunit 6 [Cacopsylla burckhardti]
MMMSLFSMFDPTAILSLPLNWMMVTISLMFIPIPMWKLNSQSLIMFNFIVKSLNKEFKALFSNTILIKGSTLLPSALFTMIMINNLSSNFPYTFCSSAHLVFSLSLSIPIWTSIVLFYWTTLTKSMMAHLVPSGTPNILMPLMVLIELTSNFIRPMALAVRLTANLIAGHLLMALLGNTFNPSSYLWGIILVLQTLFLSFELMVGLIQSYVFSVLMALYSSEMS